MRPREAGGDPDLPLDARFTTTHWSVVLLAGDGGSQQAARSLETLCRTYWYPLYAYVRRRGHGPEEAQDLTQAFFVRLLAKKELAKVDQSKGRFRSFLLASMNHFLTNEWDRARALKRGGGAEILSLDDGSAESRYALESLADPTPERLYERQWALALLDRALASLRDECVSAGREGQFDALSPFLCCEADGPAHAEAGAKLGMSSAAVASNVYRLRQRYRELVRGEIAQTVAGPEDLEDELRLLFSVLS
jgi:RNA polymerase sigma factor (sigma-70 family)